MNEHNSCDTDSPDIIHIKNFITKEKCKKYEVKLSHLTYNSDEESAVVMMGKKINVPRKTTAFGEKGTSYSFAGTKLMARKYAEATFIAKLQSKINIKLLYDNVIDDSILFNFAVVNYYKNGKEYIGYHSDKEFSTNKNSDGTINIASLSFGATRDFLMQNRATKQVHTYILESGDLFIIKGNTNKNFKHKLPKRLKVHEPRYNISFRSMKV